MIEAYLFYACSFLIAISPMEAISASVGLGGGRSLCIKLPLAALCHPENYHHMLCYSEEPKVHPCRSDQRSNLLFTIWVNQMHLGSSAARHESLALPHLLLPKKWYPLFYCCLMGKHNKIIQSHSPNLFPMHLSEFLIKRFQYT